jgi:hypothetical protein
MTRQMTLTSFNRKGNTTDMKIYNSRFLLIFFLNFNIYQAKRIRENMFCMKAQQPSLVLPSKSRLVQLRIYTCYTKTCFFLGVTCHFSWITYFWSIVLFRCNDFMSSAHVMKQEISKGRNYFCFKYDKTDNSYPALIGKVTPQT